VRCGQIRRPKGLVHGEMAGDWRRLFPRGARGNVAEWRTPTSIFFFVLTKAERKKPKIKGIGENERSEKER
jgi:hypothetical protein